MSESIEAKRDGARLQKNSGRGQYQKADALLLDMSVDYKETQRSFTLSRKVWAKVCTDAARNGMQYHPVVKVIFEQLPKVRLAVIAWDYLEYLKDIESKYKELTDAEIE